MGLIQLYVMFVQVLSYKDPLRELIPEIVVALMAIFSMILPKIVKNVNTAKLVLKLAKFNVILVWLDQINFITQLQMFVSVVKNIIKIKMDCSSVYVIK